MRDLALLVAFILLGVGALCAAAPALMIASTPHLLTTTGLYVIGALRLGMGLALFWAARLSRFPRMLKGLGVLLAVAGAATPIVGVERSRAVMEFGIAQGSLSIRVAGLVLLCVGAFIGYAVTPRRTT